MRLVAEALVNSQAAAKAKAIAGERCENAIGARAVSVSPQATVLA